VTFPYAIPGVYSRPRRRAEGFARVRTDVCGFVGVAGPRHLGRSVMVDDWKAYVAAFRSDDLNQPVAPPPGAVLDASLRDFFANGGRRAVIVNVAASTDADDRDNLLNLMLGLAGDPAPHGLELLLRHPEVSVVALPDLHAEVATLEDRFEDDDLGGGSCFGPCRGHRAPPSGGQGTVGVAAAEALFDQDRLLWAQRYLIERLLRQPWRWFALLTPPKGLSVDGAISWRGRLTRGMEGPSVAALYWPWMRMQDSPGALSELRSPLGAVAGIFAEIDLTGGPHLAPANRPILGGIGPERPLTDEDNARLYEAGVGEDLTSLLKTRPETDEMYIDFHEIEIVELALGSSGTGLTLPASRPQPAFAAPLDGITHEKAKSYLEFFKAFAERMDYEIFAEFDDVTPGQAGAQATAPDRRSVSFHFEPARSGVLKALVSLHWGRDIIEFKPAFKAWDILTGARASGSVPRGRGTFEVAVTMAEAINDLHAAPGAGRAAPLSVASIREGIFADETSPAVNEAAVQAANIDQERARLQAVARLRSSAREFLTAELKTIGFTRLRPGIHVDLTGLYAPFDGIYYVTRTVHSLTAAGYLTTSTLRRPGMLDPATYPDGGTREP
jgi:hypothetical protein